jgi:hypothetical protein
MFSRTCYLGFVVLLIILFSTEEVQAKSTTTLGLYYEGQVRLLQLILKLLMVRSVTGATEYGVVVQTWSYSYFIAGESGTTMSAVSYPHSISDSHFL